MTTELNITQVNRSQVARETGTDLAHISRIFNRKATPSLVLAVRIARVLDVSVDHLCAALGIDPTEDLKAIQDTRTRVRAALAKNS